VNDGTGDGIGFKRGTVPVFDSRCLLGVDFMVMN